MSKSLKKKIREDDKYRTYKSMLKKGAYRLDISALYDEIMLMNSSRLIRQINTDKLLADKQNILIEATLQNQKYRSRSTEIKMKVKNIQGKLSNHLNRLRKYIKSAYVKELNNNGYKTISSKEEFVDTILFSGINYLSELDTFDKILYMIIEDFDKTGYAIKAVNETLSLTFYKEKAI